MSGWCGEIENIFLSFLFPCDFSKIAIDNILPVALENSQGNTILRVMLTCVVVITFLLQIILLLVRLISLLLLTLVLIMLMLLLQLLHMLVMVVKAI